MDIKKTRLQFKSSENDTDAINLLFDEDEPRLHYSGKKRPKVYRIGFIIGLVLIVTATWVTFRMIFPTSQKKILAFSAKTDESMIFLEHGINYDQIESWVDEVDNSKTPVLQKENNHMPKATTKKVIVKPVQTMSVVVAYKASGPIRSSKVMSATVKKSSIPEKVALTDNTVMLRPPVIVTEEPIQMISNLKRIKIE